MDLENTSMYIGGENKTFTTVENTEILYIEGESRLIHYIKFLGARR